MLVWFVETTLIASVLAALALLCGRWPRVGPAARHALWLAVLAKLVAPPLVCWPRPALPDSAELRAAEGPTVSLGPEGHAAGIGTGVGVGAGDLGGASRTETATPAAVSADPPAASRLAVDPIPRDPAVIRRSVLVAWAAATAAIVLAFGLRIARFRRHLRAAFPPPPWVEEQARLVARSLGVRVPEIAVIPAATTPMLWFLGRPRLLLPGPLVASLGAESWRGILAHELAHLRRRDHWVRRLELLAGLIWWWNPIYWLTRRRLEAESELACDEWAVRAFPAGRLAYAEALLRVCESLSPPAPATPALGVAGAGRFLERRVIMILRDPAPYRSSVPAFCAAAVLALVAIPGWSASGSIILRDLDTPTAPSSDAVELAVAQQDDDDGEARKAEERAKRKQQRAKARAESRSRRSGPAREGARKEKSAAEEAAAAERTAKIAEEVEARFGPGSDFEKSMEALGEEMEARFGPDSDFAKEMEARFGPDSDFAREMEAKFGPDSDFAREMEAKFGPGSDFIKRMELLGEEMEARFGPDSDFARDVERSRVDRKSEGDTDEGDTSNDDEMTTARRLAKPKVKAGGASTGRNTRARRIEELQRRIDQLSRELHALQEDADDEGDEDDDVEDR
jgi:beta-lactamase regulating signal transducer with metallopeptidase domain